MSEPVEGQEPTTDDTTTEPDDATEQPEEWDADRAREKIRKANAEAANLRKRAAESERRAQETAAEKDRRIAELEAAQLRWEVGSRLGLPPSLVKRLQGSTEAELVEDAKALLDDIAPQKPGTRPAESLRRAGESDDDGPTVDVRKALEGIR